MRPSCIEISSGVSVGPSYSKVFPSLEDDLWSPEIFPGPLCPSQVLKGECARGVVQHLWGATLELSFGGDHIRDEILGTEIVLKN
jgi:hypothetical protein